MDIENTEGGVSPIKKKRQASRGGKHAGKATKTAKRRGGFAESSGKRGGGGRNVGGYNVQTRFQPRATQPARGGVSSSKSQPYSYDKNGDLSVDATAGADATADGMEWVPAEYGTRNGKLPTYREAWDANNKDVQSKYSNFEDFEIAAKKWNEEHGGGSTSERYKIKDGYWKVIPGGGTTSSSNSSATAKSAVKYKGKFNYGGYRTMHGQ